MEPAPFWEALPSALRQAPPLRDDDVSSQHTRATGAHGLGGVEGWPSGYSGSSSSGRSCNDCSAYAIARAITPPASTGMPMPRAITPIIGTAKSRTLPIPISIGPRTIDVPARESSFRVGGVIQRPYPSDPGHQSHDGVGRDGSPAGRGVRIATRPQPGRCAGSEVSLPAGGSPSRARAREDGRGPGVGSGKE